MNTKGPNFNFSCHSSQRSCRSLVRYGLVEVIDVRTCAKAIIDKSSYGQSRALLSPRINIPTLQFALVVTRDSKVGCIFKHLATKGKDDVSRSDYMNCIGDI